MIRYKLCLDIIGQVFSKYHLTNFSVRMELVWIKTEFVWTKTSKPSQNRVKQSKDEKKRAWVKPTQTRSEALFISLPRVSVQFGKRSRRSCWRGRPRRTPPTPGSWSACGGVWDADVGMGKAQARRRCSPPLKSFHEAFPKNRLVPFDLYIKIFVSSRGT